MFTHAGDEAVRLDLQDAVTGPTGHSGALRDERDGVPVDRREAGRHRRARSAGPDFATEDHGEQRELFIGAEGEKELRRDFAGERDFCETRAIGEVEGAAE